MRKTVLALTFAAAAFVATHASATTVLTTTQTDVKRECGGKTKCSTVCGSTYCDYVCDDPKKQCTVAVFMKAPKKGPKPPVTAPKADSKP